MGKGCIHTAENVENLFLTYFMCIRKIYFLHLLGIMNAKKWYNLRMVHLVHKMESNYTSDGTTIELIFW